MNFDLSDDQKLLRDELRRMLAAESPRALARQAIERHDRGEPQALPAVWRHLVDMGATALTLPEACGGAGLGPVELCIAAEEIGRQLSPVPFGSTLYGAAQALRLAGTPAQQGEWLPRIARGEVATLAAPLDGAHPVALPRFDGWALHGTVPLVADGELARWAVVLAQADDGPCWVAVDLDEATVTRRRLAVIDAARPVAELRFHGTPGQRLNAAADALALLDRLRQRLAVLLAFEQLGAADAALEVAAAYARERFAFGRAIGSYQGIKHKLADLYTANQMARVHALYAAWALQRDDDAAQPFAGLGAAAAAARVAATRASTLAAQEGLHVHGGIGYTWELDAQLFYRRARHQAAWLGHEHDWRERLAAALEARIDTPDDEAAAAPAADPGAMGFDDAPDEAAFRAECRAWLTAHARPKARPDQIYGAMLTPEARMQAARAWQARKAAAGFGAITWPVALGGRGGTPIQEVIWRQEEGRFDVPTHAFGVSLGMVIPSLFVHADAAVRERHVGPALRGEHLWCQLLSEPGAGSDLGMLRTRAEPAEQDGVPGWRLNGQKVWTSLAQFADYGMVLARTDPGVPKFDGLTTFYVDMRSPGITVRPIRQANGEAEFNEVFLDNVFVPDAQRVGAPGAGWKVTLTALMNERLAIGGVMPPDLWRTAARLLRDTPWRGAPALSDGRLRERLADLYLNAQGLWLLQCRGLTALGKGKEPGPELSVAKIVGARTLQDFAAMAIDLQGQRGVLAAAEVGEAWTLVERLWWGSAGMRIAGGTDEIVKNNVGERVLGLPPEPRTDKGVPFNQLKG